MRRSDCKEGSGAFGRKGVERSGAQKAGWKNAGVDEMRE